MFRRPCCRHRCPQVNDDKPHVRNIKQQRKDFKPKRGARIARTRDGTEQYRSYTVEWQGRDQYVQRQHGILYQ